jgi:membrane-bound lytic murein transglycosylase A
MMKNWLGATALGLFWAGATVAEPTYTLMTFDDLTDWATDDHEAALTVFTDTCGDMKNPEWAGLCAFAKTAPDARAFFESFFQPVLVQDGDPMLFTGYFEPELKGSKTRGGPYQYPIYRLPPDHIAGQEYITRQQIEENQPLAGKELEIAWLTDPVDLFFLQVQGSGRIRLPDGGGMRVGYGGKNGFEYSSVGQELVRRGTYKSHQVSAQVIRNWVRENPTDGQKLLWVNKSYVFFREVSEVPADKGPLGAMNRSITAHRSIAVDPAFTTLGTPVWIEKEGAAPIHRLMVAQDTGSAIKGAQRADIFYGTGDQAGRIAGRIKDGGRMIRLLPIQMAYKLLPETIK